MGKSRLEGKIEDIIECIISGDTYRVIAEKFEVPLSTLHDFISSTEHSARVKAAQEISADSYADKAEKVLIDAKGTLTEISRARELAQHYRWKASKRSPKRFGDRLELDGGVDNRTTLDPEQLAAIADRINANGK